MNTHKPQVDIDALVNRCISFAECYGKVTGKHESVDDAGLLMKYQRRDLAIEINILAPRQRGTGACAISVSDGEKIVLDAWGYFVREAYGMTPEKYESGEWEKKLDVLSPAQTALPENFSPDMQNALDDCYEGDSYKDPPTEFIPDHDEE